MRALSTINSQTEWICVHPLLQFISQINVRFRNPLTHLYYSFIYTWYLFFISPLFCPWAVLFTTRLIQATDASALPGRGLHLTPHTHCCCLAPGLLLILYTLDMRFSAEMSIFYVLLPVDRRPDKMFCSSKWTKHMWYQKRIAKYHFRGIIWKGKTGSHFVMQIRRLKI